MREVQQPGAELSADYLVRTHIWGWILLLTSTSALVCCVIPIALVSMGLGAAVAALYSNLPFLTFLGLHKDWTFVLTALILAAAVWALFRPGRACPADPELARACQKADRWNRRLLFLSMGLWALGFFAAYLLLPIAERLNLL